MIRANNITVCRQNRPIIENLSLSLKAGEVTAILGPNGAGKTTLIQALAGLLPIESGTIQLDDLFLAEMKPALISRKIAWLAQGGEGHWPLSVWDTVALGRIPHRKSWSLLAHMSPSADDQTIIQEVLEETNTNHLIQRRLNQLSGGERARVLLARALAVRAPILLADEPTAYLDPGQQVKIMVLLQRRAYVSDVVVVVLHDLHLARQYCHRVIMLNHGKIVADGSPDSILTPELLTSVYGSLDLRFSPEGSPDPQD